jgi:hypothetical protein
MSLLLNRQPKAKVLRPVHGIAKWLSPMGFLGTGVLAINGTMYTVLRLSSGVGYRLEKTDGTLYDVNTEAATWTCDCPDATYNPGRPGGCKHVAALRAALAAVGQQ